MIVTGEITLVKIIGGYILPSTSTTKEIITFDVEDINGNKYYNISYHNLRKSTEEQLLYLKSNYKHLDLGLLNI